MLFFVPIGNYRPKSYGFNPNYNKKFYINRNNYIRAEELFVVGEEGEVLGKMKTPEALRIAKERELDLIEISPNADPPIAKIMSWSKYKYNLSKKKKEQKNRSIEQKEMRFKAFIGEGDLEHKLKKVSEFLDKKHPVKIQIRAVSRSTMEHMYDLLKKITTRLEDKAQTDGSAKREGRNLSIIIRPKK